MSKIKQYNRREFICILKNNGYEYESCKGDHGKFIKANSPTIVIPMAKHSLNKMLCRRLIKENNLKV